MNDFLQKFGELTKPSKTMFERLELLRGKAPESEVERAVRLALRAAERERREAQPDPIAAMLADPEKRSYLDSMCRILGRAKVSGDAAELLDVLRVQKGLDPSTTLGDALFAIPFAEPLDAVLLQGVVGVLANERIATTKKTFPKQSSVPTSYCITPTMTGSNRIPADTTPTGSGISLEMVLIVVRILVSQEWLEDSAAERASWFLRMLTQSIAARLDFCAMQGTGADDIASGGMVGVFTHSSITAASAATGHQTVGGLQRNDFLEAVAALAPAALQRPCRWFIHRSLIPALMGIIDGTGPQYLLKTPAETGSDWMLVGFPVSWAAQAPSTVTPGSKIAALGEPKSYLIALREDFNLAMGDGALFPANVRQIRGMARAFCAVREPTWWATLKLAGS